MNRRRAAIIQSFQSAGGNDIPHIIDPLPPRDIADSRRTVPQMIPPPSSGRQQSLLDAFQADTKAKRPREDHSFHGTTVIAQNTGHEDSKNNRNRKPPQPRRPPANAVVPGKPPTAEQLQASRIATTGRDARTQASAKPPIQRGIVPVAQMKEPVTPPPASRSRNRQDKENGTEPKMIDSATDDDEDLVVQHQTSHHYPTMSMDTVWRATALLLMDT